MGCSLSTGARAQRPPKGLELRMQAALREIIAHKRHEGNQGLDASFNRIILKFPIIRVSRSRWHT
jgi:hypothetical protein